jgi:hypothetical protein
VIRQRPIGCGSLPRGTEVRAEAGTGFAWFGLPPFAMLHVAVEWDGCLWHATPGTAWIYWHNDRAAGWDDAAVAAGVITRESAGGVRQLRLADLALAAQVQQLRDELQAACTSAEEPGREPRQQHLHRSTRRAVPRHVIATSTRSLAREHEHSSPGT